MRTLSPRPLPALPSPTASIQVWLSQLDVQVGPGSLVDQYDSESILLSPSRNTPSPRISTPSNYSGFFINRHSCGYLAGSENDDGHHLSEQPNAFRELYQAPSAPSTSCTISFEMNLKHEEDLPPVLSFDLPTSSRCPNYMLPKKTKVASPRVLAASRRRRGPTKQGARLYSCPQCCNTFTARHNLTSEPALMFTCCLLTRDLVDHINSHSGIRPYCCNACGLSFGTKHVLRRHQKTCQAFLMHASTLLTHRVGHGVFAGFI